MSVIAESTARGNAASPEAEAERLKYRLAVAAISEFSGRALAELSLPDALRLLAARACAVLGIARCSVFVADPGQDQYLGVAAYPREEIEQAVLRLRLGGPNDRLTREIVATGAPLLIRDAHTDPRALTGAIRAWKLRSLLGVPMLSGEGTVGLMMFDNDDRLHPYAPSDLEVALVFAALGAALVARVHQRQDLQNRLEAVMRQNKLLRRTTVAERRLSDCMLRGAGLEALVDLAARLTGKPAALYETGGQRVAASVPEQASAEPEAGLLEEALADPRLGPALQEAVSGASVMIEPVVPSTDRRRHLAAPVDVAAERWGWLVLQERSARFVSFDEFLVRRASTYLSLELTGRRRQVASNADARALLARQLIRGTTAEDELIRSAEFLGIRLVAHRVLVYVKADPDAFDADALCEALQARTGMDVLVTKGPEGWALLAEVRDDEAASVTMRTIKAALIESFQEVETGVGEYSVGVSGVSRAAAAIPGAYREARQVASCIENVADGTQRILTADDLGPARLFVANADLEELARFTEDVLGRLLEESEGSLELLRTLEAFYDTGRSVRLASDRLGVHENTVRYRLSRVQMITGLDVAADADDQLSVQVALLVLRLQGHPGLRPVDAERPAQEPAGATADGAR